MTDGTRLELRIRPLAESALLVEIAETIEPAATARVMELTAALDALALPGVVDLVPSYTTLLVAFDPVRTDPATLTDAIHQRSATPPAASAVPARTMEIPVRYGGEYGPDLDDVVTHTGLSRDEVIARHSEAVYTVACMGFAPGFAFLTGLPPELSTPRLDNPRTRVPTGMVGIGGVQTGIYPLPTPGGWRLIGRTPRRLFDLSRAEPFLLQPGDQVRFRSIDDETFREIERQASSGDPDRDALSEQPSDNPEPIMSEPIMPPTAPP